MNIRRFLFPALLLLLVLQGCTVSSAPSSAVSSALSPPDRIRTIVKEQLGTCNRSGIAKVGKVDVFQDDSQAGYTVDIVFAMNNDITMRQVVLGAKTDVYDAMKALYNAGYPIAEVVMHGSFTTQDEHANFREEIVLECTLTGETARKINWTSLNRDSLFDILDRLWWHPTFVDSAK